MKGGYKKSGGSINDLGLGGYGRQKTMKGVGAVDDRAIRKHGNNRRYNRSGWKKPITDKDRIKK